MQNMPKSLKVIGLAFLLVLATGVGLYLYQMSTGNDSPLSPFIDNADRVDSTVFADSIGSAAVNINGATFGPATVTIKKGWQVVWTNKDTTAHRVAADPYPAVEGENLFDSEAIGPGESFAFTFSQPGTYGFHDPINPLEMRGTVIVE